MNRTIIAAAVLGVALMGCGSETQATGSATTSAKPAPSASGKPSAAAQTPSAAPSAASTENACQKKKLTAGGTGDMGDKCKYSGEILTAKYTGKIDDHGAVFEITNPWPEEVNMLTEAALYYYDKSGKQLSVKQGDATKKANFLTNAEVKLAGNKASEVSLGWPKSDLPKDVDSVELVIMSFGWDLGEGKGAYFVSTDNKYTEERAKGGGKADDKADATKGDKKDEKKDATKK